MNMGKDEVLGRACWVNARSMSCFPAIDTGILDEKSKTAQACSRGSTSVSRRVHCFTRGDVVSQSDWVNMLTYVTLW